MVRRQLWLERQGSPYVFNFGSTKNLCWLLFEKYGLSPLAYTDKGSPKVDKATLPEYDVPFKTKLLEKKKLEKLLSTYVEGILSRQREGKIYPEFLQYGTTSGRYSCKNPNFQNLPRDDKSIKQGIVAPPGYVFVNADFSALEIRCFAHVTGDKKMQMIFEKNLDFYSQIAIDVFGITQYSADETAPNFLKKQAPELRNRAKLFALAVAYGASAYRLHHSLNCSVQEAQALIDDYLEAYPGLKNYINSRHNELLRTGKVATQFGRVRHLPEAKEMWNTFGKKILNRRVMIDVHGDWGLDQYRKMRNMMNLCTNHPIQGLAAHIANASMITVAELLKNNNLNAQPVLQVHDECTLISSLEHAELAAKLLQQAMEQNWVAAKLLVPMLAEPIVATNLAEAK
jgi:DNA polymerase-1